MLCENVNDPHKGLVQTGGKFWNVRIVNRSKDHDIFLLRMGDGWIVLEKNIFLLKSRGSRGQDLHHHEVQVQKRRTKNGIFICSAQQ
jgi:hypothetical protein